MPDAATATPTVRHPDRLFAGGRWVAPAGVERIDVENPATEEVIAAVPAGGPKDVDVAVAAARAAAPAWAATPAAERARLLLALRDALAERQEQLAALVTAEMGAPARLARTTQTALPLQVLEAYAGLAQDVEGDETVGNSLVLREPAGVVAAITPWNYPLHQAVVKVGAALLAGCTVVHKPSEVAPLSAHALAEAVEAADLPAGVYNLVDGTGAGAGEALVAHPDVDMVSFTGSTRAGRRVAALAAESVTRVALELGGKSANLILEDADLGAAVKVGVANCFLNAGQTCTAWTRMLAPSSRYDEVVERAVAAAAAFVPADPTDPATRLGPLASRAQLERVTGYVERGLRDGARRVAGGGTEPLPPRGHYVRATIFADVDPDAVIAQEEIFGPVLVIIRYRDEDDAVRIANGTRYGLAGGVWSADAEHALAVARRLRAGQVDVNGARFNPAAPFGGYGESGYGRELGLHGVAEFQVLKSLQLP